VVESIARIAHWLGPVAAGVLALLEVLDTLEHMFEH
jgi:hypothetical protein